MFKQHLITIDRHPQTEIMSRLLKAPEEANSLKIGLKVSTGEVYQFKTAHRRSRGKSLIVILFVLKS